MSQPKLIKRITTEEFLDVSPEKKKAAKTDEVEADIDADEDDALDGCDDECDDEEAEKATPRRRAR